MFYDNFINICRVNGYSPSRVLTELGISRGSLGRWKAGGAPRNEYKKKIADYLGVTVDELIAEKEKPVPPKGDELKGIDAELYDLLKGLTPEQAVKVRSFIAGIKA